MNIIKIFGAIGAAALAAGGLIVAGRTGLGKSDDPVDEKAPETGDEPEAPEEEADVQTEPADDDGADA